MDLKSARIPCRTKWHGPDHPHRLAGNPSEQMRGHTQERRTIKTFCDHRLSQTHHYKLEAAILPIQGRKHSHSSGDHFVASHPKLKLRHGGLTPATRRHKIVITAVTGGSGNKLTRHLNNILSAEENQQHNQTYNHQVFRCALVLDIFPGTSPRKSVEAGPIAANTSW